ncbi:MAG: prepilin-type N-terminal cleavage/methylation domain-containing protein [candidate division Zixibacteria bacterium]|nr:prepilin-type N-terminal cleavage/methylation domain-containing protein [candidate division Zixibacteria bacterium]
MNIKDKNSGFTLIEVVLVIVIIGILSTVAIKSLTVTVKQKRFDATAEEMDHISKAIVGDERLVGDGIRSDFGYVGDVGALPSSLDDLVTNPGGYSTWNGPYISSSFSENTDDYKRDGWNELYTYTGGVSLSSSGGGTTVTKQFANSAANLTSNTVTGIVRDFDLSIPGDSSSNVTVTISYPDGSGSTTSSSTSPNGSGEFTFSSSIPIGTHQLRAVNGSDTVSKYVAVYPGKMIISELRFASDLWGGQGGGGGGGGSGDIVYVDGSSTSGGAHHDHMSFDIENTSGSSISITSLVPVFTSSPASSFGELKWDGTKIWNDNNDQTASGETVNFASQSISAGSTITVEFKKFRTPVDGNTKFDIRGTEFTVTFSNGDEVTFTVPSS